MTETAANIPLCGVKTVILRVSLGGRWRLPAFVSKQEWEPNSSPIKGEREIHNMHEVSVEELFLGFAQGHLFGLKNATYKEGRGDTHIMLCFERGEKNAYPFSSLKRHFSKTARYLDLYRYADARVIVTGRMCRNVSAAKHLVLEGEQLQIRERSLVHA